MRGIAQALDQYDDDEEYDGLSTLSELSRQAHFPVGHVMLSYRAALNVLGLRDPIVQRLGRGVFGEAFTTMAFGKKKSVLKLTRDPTEAVACAVLAGKPTKRVVPIYSIWTLPDTHIGNLRGWYCVHRGYLNPISKKDKKIVDTIFDLYIDNDLALKMPRKHHRAMRDRWKNYLRGELKEVFDDEDTAAVLLPKAMIFLEEIAEAVHEMHDNGIDWSDCHAGNMMRDDAGRLVAGDVGWGEMHEDSEHEVPELTVDRAKAYVAGLS